MSELAFVGDIHGSADHLERLLPDVLRRTRQVVFLGDYVNRGPDSRRVLEILLELNEDPDISAEFLEGNHDRLFLDAINSQDVSKLLLNGGAPTISSYLRETSKPNVAAQLAACVPLSHVEFLKSLKREVFIGGVYASHSSRSGPPAGAIEATFKVFGHSPRADLLPSIAADEARIDTGCGTLPHGRLTALFWPSLTWTQSV